MRPIYAALREMDWVGVRVAGGRRGEEVTKLDLAYLAYRPSFRMRLWNLDQGKAQIIGLQEDPVEQGKYLGEWVDLEGRGWWRWWHEVVSKSEIRQLDNANEAIEWLVEKIASSVTDARGLGVLPKGRRGAVPWNT